MIYGFIETRGGIRFVNSFFKIEPGCSFPKKQIMCALLDSFFPASQKKTLNKHQNL